MSAPGEAPSLVDTTEALEILTDILIAAQEVGDRFDRNGRPYLRYCARQLEDAVHDAFHSIELIATGWEPTNHDDR